MPALIIRRGIGGVNVLRDTFPQDFLGDGAANGVRRSYGRGSVNGSMIAYLLVITEMDS